MYKIAINNEHTSHSIDEARLRRAVRSILNDQRIKQATLSIAIVDDVTIRRLNRRFLRHDRTTDVLSFVLDETLTTLDGEVVASADTAAKKARRFGWTTDDELLLYVIHGTLHLVGYDDRTADDRAVMRGREQQFLKRFGLTPRYDGTRITGASQGRAGLRRQRRTA